MKYSQKYERNPMTYSSDTVMLNITRTHSRDGQKGCILPFPKKGDFRINKNYWGMTLTFISAKVYNPLLLNRIKPEMEKIVWKNQNGFWRKRSTTLQFLTIHQIIEGVCAKKPWGNTLIWRFLQGIWFHTQREDRANTSSIWPPHKKKTITAIMILYKTTKVKVCSPDGDTDFFEIAAGVLQGDTLA